MKKALALALTAAMGVTALCACAKTEETAAPETAAPETTAATEAAETQAPETEATAAETEAPETEATAAETTAAVFDPTVTPDLQNLFETGVQGLMGVDYEPVLYMGVPAEDPLGNTFLCIASAVTPDAQPYWVLVTMEDVGSEVNITEIKTIDYAASSTAATAVFADDNGGAAFGAFEPVTDIIVPDEVQNVDGHVFNEVLATQVVAGMNYSCLCRENDQWEIVTVFVNTDGVASVLNIAALNI